MCSNIPLWDARIYLKGESDLQADPVFCRVLICELLGSPETNQGETQDDNRNRIEWDGTILSFDVTRKQFQLYKLQYRRPNINICTDLKLDIQRGTAIIERGSFRKRVKWFGPLWAFSAIWKGQAHRGHFFYRAPKKAPMPKWKAHLYFSLKHALIWRGIKVISEGI